MIYRPDKLEEEVMSVEDTFGSWRAWRAQYERMDASMTLDQKLLHKIASLSLSESAAVAHRLDQMHLTMLRILTLMEASSASKPSQTIEDANRDAEDQG